MKRGVVTRAAIVAGLVLAAGSIAEAGNEEEQLLGPGAALSAGAVTAVVDDGSAIIYNPAGLAQVELATLDVTTSAFVLRLYEVPDLISSPVSIESEGSFTEFVSVPAGLTFVRPITADLRMGFGVFSVGSRNVSIRDEVSIPLEDGLASRWLVVLEETETATEIGASLAWNVSDSFRLGATLLLRQESYLSKETLAGGVADEFDDTKSASQSYDLFEFQSYDLAPILGLQWEAGAWGVGASIRLPSTELAYFEKVFFAETIVFPGQDPFNSFSVTDEARDVFEFEMDGTSRVRAGLAYKWSGGHVALDGDLFFSLFDSGNVEAALPQFNLRVGTQLDLSDELTVGAGLFSDRSTRDFLDLPANHQTDLYGGTLGARFGGALIHGVRDNGGAALRPGDRADLGPGNPRRPRARRHHLRVHDAGVQAAGDQPLGELRCLLLGLRRAPSDEG